MKRILKLQTSWDSCKVDGIGWNICRLLLLMYISYNKYLRSNIETQKDDNILNNQNQTFDLIQ